jgi:hypothetical protein
LGFLIWDLKQFGCSFLKLNPQHFPHLCRIDGRLAHETVIKEDEGLFGRFFDCFDPRQEFF